VLAAFTVFTTIGLPVAALSTWLSAVQFDVTLIVSWTVVPFALLVSLMATSVGYGMAMAVPDPRMAVMITNIVIFVVLLFSPMVIPIERFPDWAATLHRVLPFYHMANLLRSSLTEGLVTGVGASLAILLAWTTVSWAILARIVVRRG
jgi:ABC-2 type transport system permease protein